MRTAETQAGRQTTKQITVTLGLGTENLFQYGTGSYTTDTYPDRNVTQISVLPFGV